MFAGHLDLSFPLVTVVPDVLDEAACATLIARIESGEAERAPVIGRVGERDVGEVVDDRRTNTRVMFDDAELARSLYARVRPSLPALVFGRAPCGCNERIRLYRYGPSQRHSAHWDTPLVLDHVESALTFVVYLNSLGADDDPAGLRGGSTEFPEIGQRFVPTRGTALLFQQRVLHEALPVEAGVKYVVRTEVMVPLRK